MLFFGTNFKLLFPSYPLNSLKCPSDNWLYHLLVYLFEEPHQRVTLNLILDKILISSAQLTESVSALIVVLKSMIELLLKVMQSFGFNLFGVVAIMVLYLEFLSVNWVVKFVVVVRRVLPDWFQSFLLFFVTVAVADCSYFHYQRINSVKWIYLEI